MFRSSPPRSRRAPSDPLTPRFALAVAMAYVVAADGHLTDEERYDLRKVVPSDDDLDAALEYSRRTPTTRFLEECRALLTAEQQLCMLLNMLDAAMVDGNVAPEERVLLDEFQTELGISTETIAPYEQCLERKNSRRIFG